MGKVRSNLPPGIGFAIALGVLIAISLAGVAGAEKPATSRTGNLELILDGGFSPRGLAKTSPTPISLSISGQIKTIDGTHPPALQELILETDKNGTINVKGLPACDPTLQLQAAGNPEAICKRATIGEGTANFEFAYPGSAPIPASGKLLIFNGGFKDGVTTLYARVRVNVPTPAAILATVKIKTIHKGRYGTRAIISVPKIAGGSGSVTSFSATIKKQILVKGKRISPLTLKCPDGKIKARAEALFSDGTKATVEALRTCAGQS